MLKAQLEVENADLREEIEGLRKSLDLCTSMAIASGENVGATAHVEVLKQQLGVWQQRVYDLERVLGKIVLPGFVARCDMLGLQEHDGIDIGVRAGALREAYKVLSAEPEEELLDVMKKPEVEEEFDEEKEDA